VIIIKKNTDSNRSKRWISYNDFSIDSVKSFVLNILSDYPFSFQFNKNNSKLFIKFNNNSYYIKIDYYNIGLILVNRITGIKKYYYNFSPWKNIFNDIMNNIIC
jgi:hypothetical protein